MSRAKTASERNINRQIGKRLRKRRIHEGLTLTQLQERSGILFQTIQKYETDCICIPAFALVAIAQALNTNPGEFFQGIQGPTNAQTV